jgi:tripartite-type tricarboxylate transporter receptor subunit TctC
MGLSHLCDSFFIMDFRRRRFLHLSAMAVFATLSRPAAAQSWPTRSLRLVVGFAGDDGASSIASILANRLSEIWGQQVVVERNPSDDIEAAFDEVAHAAPDGQTMLIAIGAPQVRRFLFPKRTFDLAADFAPVSLAGTFPFVIIASNSSQFDSIATLVAYAKSHPGALNWASPGHGTPPHLAGTLFEIVAGIKMTHVAYDGVTDYLVSDLNNGRVNIMFDSAGALLGPISSRQVRGLAVTSGTRFPVLPELRTVAESGVPGYDVSSWYGLYVPAGTPTEIVRKMNTDIVVMLRESAMREQLKPLGVVAATSRPDELAAKNAADAAMWKVLIEAAQITAE